MKSSVRMGVAAASVVTSAMMLLTGSSVAGAAVSGSFQDAQGDVGAASAPSGMPGGYMRDVRSYGLRYDPDAGALEAQVRFWDTAPVDAGYPWFTLRAEVGVHRGGRCDTRSAGGVVTLFSTPTDAPGSGEVTAAIAGVRDAVNGTHALAADGWSYRAVDRRLRGRGYDCVAGIRLDHVSGSFDEAGGFCLDAAGTVACPRSRPAPPAGLRVLESGDGRVTLDWDDMPLDDGDAFQVYADDRPVELSVSGSRFTVTGLRNDTAYRFRVSAGRPGAYGDWTEAIVATPRAPAPVGDAGRGVPGTPTDPGRTAPAGGGSADGPGGSAPTGGHGSTTTPGGGAGATAPAFRVLATPRLGAFSRTGLRVGVRCATGCRTTVRVVVSARVARALKTGRTLARSTRTVRAGAEAPLTVRPSKALTRRLQRLARLDATVVVETKDADRKVRRLQRRVTLRR